MPATFGNGKSDNQVIEKDEDEINDLTCKIKELEAQLEGAYKEKKKQVNDFLILTEALLKINTRIDPNVDEQKAIAGRALRSVGAIL